jgi:class 3 adenylate cyclase/tetratricopeptide (TPR) repeat protein
VPLTDNAGPAIKVDVRCAECGTDNRDGRRFCSKCGGALARSCAKCGAPNEPGDDFCGDCGASLTPSSAAHTEPAKAAEPAIRIASEASSASLEGERKTVTALFADIKGSTELMEDLDPEEARAIIDPALKLMIDAVRRYDGYVVQSTGDGIFALFGAPVAHEDHPQRALYAALRLQGELKRYSDRMRQEGRLPLQARVGVNTGEVVVRSLQTGDAHTEYTPIGHTANLAARMQVLAPIGSIATTEQVRKLCEGYFLFNGLGPTKVKGVSEPVHVYEVAGLGPLRTRLQRSAGRGLTKFVGREREMEALKHAAEQAKSGRGQIVAAMAEPGVGKSRLFFEFKATSQSGWMVLEAFSVSYGKASAYLPVIELLKEYFEIVDQDDERKRREKVNGKVLTLDRSLEDVVPYLFALLGIAGNEDTLGEMDGQTRRRRTLEGIKRLLLRESLNQPLMVIFEDLHWIDGESQALLNLLADSIGTAKILLLVNYRPEYSHQWNSKTYYTQLRLDPLGKESADEMLSALLGASPAPATQSLGASRERPSGDLQVAGRVRVQDDSIEGLKRLIIERTEGNPFFMEEMVQTLFDQGVLVRNGVVKVSRSLSQIQIPTTVQGILAARIDRLPAADKELLQTLAVIGREFPLGVIKQVVQLSSDELERILSDLQLGEFIYEQPAFPELEYTFKHALTHDVAYNSVLSERRKQLHERAAQAIEALFGGQLENHLSELAHHYSRSGNAPKAVEYLQRASEQAIERSANAEAIAQLKTALDLLKGLPDGPARARREASFQLALGGVLAIAASPGHPEVERALSRARELSAQLSDDSQLFHALGGLWYRHQISGEVETSLELAKQLLSLAKSADDAARLRFAHFAMAQSLQYLGHIVPTMEHIRQMESIISTEQRATSYHLGDAPSRWLAISANTFWLAGYPDQALRRSREALTVAEKLPHAYVLAVTRLFCGYFGAHCRYIQPVLGHAEQGIVLATEYGFSVLLPQLMIQQGWALVHLGRVEEGFDQISRGLVLQPQTGVPRHLFRRLLADVCLLAERADDGLRAVGEGLRDLEGGRRQWDHAELYRLKGELLLLQNTAATTEAESCFREAIEIARRQQAKSWELRATMSLARLLAKQGKRAEARAMLAEIYAWFTEGFDTADLKDAKALLEALAV